MTLNTTISVTSCGNRQCRPKWCLTALYQLIGWFQLSPTVSDLIVIFTLRSLMHISPEAQVNTQEYGRRPYGVGFLVIGQDESGPHLYEFSPSGNSHEYYAMSIGARSQSAKTYLEKHYESFADCTYLFI